MPPNPQGIKANLMPASTDLTAGIAVFIGHPRHNSDTDAERGRDIGAASAPRRERSQRAWSARAAVAAACSRRLWRLAKAQLSSAPIRKTCVE